MIYYQNKQQGYITLISVIAVTLIGTSIVVGLLLLGVNIFRTSISIEKSFEAKSLANACVEDEVLDAFRDKPSSPQSNECCQARVIPSQ